MTAKIDGTNGLLQNYDYQVLTTAFSYTFAAGTQILVINPAGTLATGTITMPASPADGMTITFSSTKQITALTLSGNTGQTVVSAATLLPANQATTYVYRLSDTSWYPTATVPGVMVNGTQLYRLNAAVVGTQVLTAQSIFNVGATLSASTVYEFEMVVAFSKTVGTTSHTFNLGIGGTATFNNITTNLTGANNNASLTPATNSANNVFQLTTTATISAMTSAIVLAVTNHWFVIKGTVSVNVGGTFIPQYTLSAAPGGAYSTVAGSFIKIYPLGASGAANNIGSWA